MAEYGAFGSYNILCLKFLGVTAILLNRWILPIGGASLLEGLRSTGLPCIVIPLIKVNTFFYSHNKL